jgi:uncharacterized protein (TIGR02145 family)
MIYITPFALSRVGLAHGKKGALAKLLTYHLLTISLLAFGSLVIAFPLNAQTTGTFTDSRDGHTYQTVTIGNQTWMAENLAFLPAVNHIATGLFEEECRYVYGYDGINVEEAKANPNFKIYGVLYNWTAARSACPSGWHLATDQEWMQLEKFLGMTADETILRDWRTSGEAGQKLKSTSGWINGNGSDSFGFKALPGGCRGYGGCESIGYAGYFWTASTIDGDNGLRRGFSSDTPGISRQEDRRYFGCSVRCIKN